MLRVSLTKCCGLPRWSSVASLAPASFRRFAGVKPQDRITHAGPGMSGLGLMTLPGRAVSGRDLHGRPDDAVSYDVFAPT